MYNWSLFMLSIGTVLVMLSSTLDEGTSTLVLGVFLIAISIFLIFKRKKD